MAKEIEYKFLVVRWTGVPAHWRKAELDQGYLAESESGTTVRVRLADGTGTLTIKAEIACEAGKPVAGPKTCHEFEYAIPKEDAAELLALASYRVRKTRYRSPEGLEVDVFSEALDGLVLAEAEGPEGTPPPHPPEGWEWRDVSQERGFSNRALSERGLPPGTALAVQKKSHPNG